MVGLGGVRVSGRIGRQDEIGEEHTGRVRVFTGYNTGQDYIEWRMD